MANCPGCLKDRAAASAGYCPGCLQRLFGGKKVSPHLSISKTEYDREKMRHGDRVSLPGIRNKHPMRLIDRWLELADRNGEYILKPAPDGTFAWASEVPANEHVTMQMARQVFAMDVAECALVFFRDGEPAYLTRRFDRNPNGSKCLQEDFAQLAGRTEDGHGRSYKYGYSYEGIADLMRRHIGPYPVEAEKLFGIVVFNFLVSNGDAHLKNFSLGQAPGQTIPLLTPSYGLINTALHLPDGKPMALALFKAPTPRHGSPTGTEGDDYSREDFAAFGSRIGLQAGRIGNILAKFTDRSDRVESLLHRSCLSDPAKAEYLRRVRDRMGKLAGSFGVGL